MKATNALFTVTALLILASLGDALGLAKERCVPGTVTSIDNCNICRCLPTGSYACTRKACLTKIEKPIGTACIPGQSFKRDCNSCLCKTDGSGAICTLKACLPPKRGQY